MAFATSLCGREREFVVVLMVDGDLALGVPESGRLPRRRCALVLGLDELAEDGRVVRFHICVKLGVSLLSRHKILSLRRFRRGHV